jgi:thiol-disulfide isomerase/thioredoxin
MFHSYMRRRGCNLPVWLAGAALIAGWGMTRSTVAAELTAKESLIGVQAAEWEVGDWINSRPQTLKELRGKVVLIRWWTGPGCPYCIASAPILRDLNKRYGKRGLVVIGLYHPKSEGPVNGSEVAQLAKELGMDFPIAVDAEWKTLNRYLLDQFPNAPFTSVSFLIDQEGIIRYVHSGGTITQEDKKDLERRVLALLGSSKP